MGSEGQCLPEFIADKVILFVWYLYCVVSCGCCHKVPETRWLQGTERCSRAGWASSGGSEGHSVPGLSPGSGVTGNQ